MKLDLMVYGRGQDRLEGYQTFAAPSYWTEQMLITMDRFNELWTGGDLHDVQPAAFVHDANPWGRTYMFICMPPPYCCALLRCTRVEGDTPGTWRKEVRNFDIWSLEGWCAPYEQREQFFALLPSLILWMEQDNRSLYGRLERKEISSSMELNAALLVNPYNDDQPLPAALSAMPTEQAQNTWGRLLNRIHDSTKPFQFLFGPFAMHFAAQIGSHYGIAEVFSTLVEQPEAGEGIDPLRQMVPITYRRTDVARETLRLRLRIVEGRRGEWQRRWGLYKPQSADPQQDCYESSPVPLDAAQGIAVVDLFAEANAVRQFARRQKWVVSDDNAESHLRFTFHKEEVL